MADGQINAAIVGASGFAGGELCRLLLNHPKVKSILPVSRQELVFERVHPNLIGSGLNFASLDEVYAGRVPDIVFLASPSGRAMELAQKLLDIGTRIVDLSADFRFPDPVQYEKVYGRRHTAPELLPSAVYGVAETNRSDIRSATLVANPGCYAITAFLGLLPLYENGLADSASLLHIAAINGTTGAGTTPRSEILHAYAYSSMLPYSLDGHRHAPEIEQSLSIAGGQGVRVDLTTAHGNFARGTHVQASVPFDSSALSRKEMLDLYTDRFKDAPFVRINTQVAQGGKTDKDYGRYPTLARVIGSNFCHIGVDVDTERSLARIVSVTDNLVKGAAGSAIQNMNIMFGFEETTGLRAYGL